jgi:16S rRNA C1402 (ribose-2'-O) methylase RsmI
MGERDELKAELAEKQKYILFLEAENKRLREALRQIAEITDRMCVVRITREALDEEA